jgi:indole-3-glycerol phosphate synthase
MDDEQLENMLACAREHSLFVLLESFDEDDLARSGKLLERSVHAESAASGQLMIGVNSRNLRTLAVDPTRLERFAADLPDGAVAVAESGLQVAEDATRVAKQGYRMALVGSALMKSEAPEQLVADMLAAGRAGVAA